MTATEVEVQVGTAPQLDVDVQFGDEPQIDVAVQIEPPTFTIMSVLPTGPRGAAGADGVDGTDGVDGEGVPVGGALGQVLTKQSGTDFDTDWEDPTGGSGGAPDDATYLVTTAHGDLSAEVVVGATPGGELGGTWASPTVDTTHSGSSHASVQAAAEATAAAALASHEADTTAIHGIANTANLVLTSDSRLSDARTPTVHATSHQDGGSDELALDGSQITTGTVADARIASTIARDSEVTAAVGAEATARDAAIAVHVNDTSDAHDASAISILDTANDFAATDVEGALAELQTADEADEAALAAHLADTVDAHDASAVSFVPNGSIAATDVQAAIQEVRDEAGSGSLTDAIILAPTTSVRNVIEGVGDVTELTLKADAGQTEPIQVWKDESGNVIARLMPNGDLVTYPGGGATGSNISIGDPSGDNVFTSLDYADSPFLRRGGMGLYAQTDDSTVRAQLIGDAGMAPDGSDRIVEMKGDSANDGHTGYFRFRHTEALSEVGVQANVGQTAPLLDLKDEDGNDCARIQTDGSIGTLANTEPADADILDGECRIWFDPTNGAARYGLKGKTLDGTVVFAYGPMGP